MGVRAKTRTFCSCTASKAVERSAQPSPIPSILFSPQVLAPANAMNPTRFLTQALALSLSLASLSAARADRIWWDGSRDAENAPPGKLLSDNAGWWGERVATGVEYSYAQAPDNPADPNKRLLDGVPQGDWNTVVGTANRPIVITFDFKRDCTFSEVDIATRSKQAAFKIECANAVEGPWRVAYDKAREEAADKNFHRLSLPEKPRGRFLRLTVNAVAPALNQWLTYMEEVVVWGDSDVQDAPESIQAVAPTPVITGVALPSIPGAQRTTFSDSEFGRWRASIGNAAGAAVWSPLTTWDSITDKPLLPVAAQVNRALSLPMARNETESAALALTSTSMTEPADVEVSLSPFYRVEKSSRARMASATVRGEMRVAGAIHSRHHGAVIGPLFSPGNVPGASLLRRYLTNTDSIVGFPRLTLSPGGSAVLWLSVEARDAAPGIYQAQLQMKPVGKTGGKATPPVTLPVSVQVLDVTLPKPFVYLNTWDHQTGQFPFAYADRQEREVAHKSSIGVSVYHHLPTPGSEAAQARKLGRTVSHLRLLPYDYVNRGFNNQMKPGDITDKDRAAITAHVRALVKEAKALGLGSDDWYGELWDEPGRGNPELYGVLSRIVKEADPKVRLYANPIFWEGSGTAPDDIIAPLLSPWYSLVDVSVPFDGLLSPSYAKSAPLFRAPRLVRASYHVSTHGDKNERASQVDSYRRQGWDAFARGENGWGFFSYYSPIGDPWNDFDGAYPDYIMVYPGPRGPIPTRTSENVREGWEDYRLLTLLRSQGKQAQISALLKAHEAGEAGWNLRERALRMAAAKPTQKTK